MTDDDGMTQHDGGYREYCANHRSELEEIKSWATDHPGLRVDYCGSAAALDEADYAILDDKTGEPRWLGIGNSRNLFERFCRDEGVPLNIS